MADVFVARDFEMGFSSLHSASKLLHGETVKGDMCGTPFSQASTAPSTPFHLHTADPLHVPAFPWSRATSPGLSECDQTPTQGVSSVCMPPLKSELGQWAKAMVEAEEWLDKQAQINHHRVTEADQLAHRAGIVSAGLPPLSSDLGSWAKALVEAEEWLEEQEQKRDDKMREKYIVDNSVLRMGTCGLALRKSKRVDDVDTEVQGPYWGTEVEGISNGDGWLRVGDRFLPMVLHNMCVMTPSPELPVVSRDDDDCDTLEESETASQCLDVSAMTDGPAITEDGRVVDLDGGEPIFFSSDAELSSGHYLKLVMINAKKAFQMAELTGAAIQAESEVVSEEVCSIDPDGEIRGAEVMSSSQTTKEISAAAAQRLKNFYRKRRNRRQGGAVAIRNDLDPIALSVNEKGRVCVHVYLKSQGFHRKFAGARRGPTIPGTETVMTIDSNGIIHDFPTADD